MPNKEFKMLGKDEIKEQAILRGMKKWNTHNLNSAKLNLDLNSKVALMVKTDICFPSCIWLSFLLDHRLVQHPQTLSLNIVILWAAVNLFSLVVGRNGFVLDSLQRRTDVNKFPQSRVDNKNKIIGKQSDTNVVKDSNFPHTHFRYQPPIHLLWSKILQNYYSLRTLLPANKSQKQSGWKRSSGSPSPAKSPTLEGSPLNHSPKAPHPNHL